MEGSLAALGTAVWLGILTSISPCPLASNIAALSYLSKNVQSRGAILTSGASYTLGRVVAYVGVSAILVAGLLSIFSLSHFLQTWTNRIIGPVLILLGFVLLEWIRIPMPSMGSSERLERLSKGGSPGAAALGFIFALSFCPISAALFFGSLIPLSVEQGSKFLIPSLFGIGTAAPVAVFAVMIALGARSIGRTYERITLFAKWAKRITAIVFFLAGLYYLLTYWLGVSVWTVT
ncbi:MAG: aromatic aminobenezylarsenical efflux permease ArsG family transporter [bacterium]|nr:aromatic aminobenezylarsenical efflux permease ArsG family transporter [bacterium]